jgi:hypothetical protein
MKLLEAHCRPIYNPMIAPLQPPEGGSPARFLEPFLAFLGLP